MNTFTPELLRAYLDDALSDAESARLEQELRRSEPLRLKLRDLMQQRDRGDHSIGSVWRRDRLTCPTREQIGSFLLEALEPGLHDYIDFHLKTSECPVCLANFEDLQEARQGPARTHRRKRYFETSAGLLAKR
jgi:hypothetical protein